MEYLSPRYLNLHDPITNIKKLCMKRLVSCRERGQSHAFPRQLTTFSFKHQLLICDRITEVEVFKWIVLSLIWFLLVLSRALLP